MFSANTALHTWETVTWQTDNNLTNIGVVCQNTKRCFLVIFGVLVFFFGFSVFLCFCFVHNSPKWLFSWSFRGFLSILFPQKACLKLLFSSYFVLCAFVFPFKKSIFAFVHQPLFRKDSLWGFLFFWICLPFPFLMFAWLFETNFPNIPFLKPKLLSCLAISFLFFCCSCVCFHGVCVSLSVSMLALFLVFSCFCSVFWFLSCFLFCFQTMKKSCFPCNSAVFWVMLVKRVVWFFLCYVFVLVCFSCVACFHFQEFVCIILFLCCCCHKIEWSSCLHLVVLLPFLFSVVLFWIFLFLLFITSPKKDLEKNRAQQKPQKAKKQKKRTKKNQLAQLCSHIVFFNFSGWA